MRLDPIRGWPHRIVVGAIAHGALTAIALMAAAALRFEFDIPAEEMEILRSAVWPLVGLRVLFFAREHLLDTWWSYVGIRDVSRLIRATLSGSLAFMLLVMLPGFVPGFARSVFILEGVLTLQLTIGARVATRLLRSLVTSWKARGGRRVVLVGGGPLAESILRDLDLHPVPRIPVGCFHDEEERIGPRVRQLPRLGTTADLDAWLAPAAADELWVALPASERETIKRVVRLARSRGIASRTMASLEETLGGSSEDHGIAVSNLFDTGEPRVLEERDRRFFAQKRVVLAGAAGTIGAALAKELARAHPRELVIVDRNESGLYYLEREIQQDVRALPLVSLVADLRDAARVDAVFREHAPDIVVFAAGGSGAFLGGENARESLRNTYEAARTVATALRDRPPCRAAFLSCDPDRPGPWHCVGRAVETVLGDAAPRSTEAPWIAIRFPTVLESPFHPLCGWVAKHAPSTPFAWTADTLQVPSLRTIVPMLLETIARAESSGVVRLDPPTRMPVRECLERVAGAWNLDAPPVETTRSEPTHGHEDLDEELAASAPAWPQDVESCLKELDLA